MRPWVPRPGSWVIFGKRKGPRMKVYKVKRVGGEINVVCYDTDYNGHHGLFAYNINYLRPA